MNEFDERNQSKSDLNYLESKIYDNRPNITQPIEKKIDEIIQLKENEIEHLLSKKEIDQTDQFQTIFDETLQTIIDKSIKYTLSFQNDYMKLYQLKQKEKGNSIINYLYAFLEYISDDEKPLYVGIILIVFGILSYFFNPYNYNESNS